MILVLVLQQTKSLDFQLLELVETVVEIAAAAVIATEIGRVMAKGVLEPAEGSAEKVAEESIDLDLIHLQNYHFQNSDSSG